MQIGPADRLRIAVVTPYYRESLEVLRHCHDSVRQQTYPATHYLVADGYPTPEVSNWPAEHIILSKSHDDNGNTPRGVGSLSAMNQGFDAIAYLDADNWYYSNHIESMVKLHVAQRAAVCTATCAIHRLNGSFMYVDTQESDGANARRYELSVHDAGSLPSATHLGDDAATVGPICDRIFWLAIRARHFRTPTTCNRPLPFALNIRPTTRVLANQLRRAPSPAASPSIRPARGGARWLRECEMTG